MNSLSQPPALEEFCCCFCLGEQLTGGRAVCTPPPARICSVGPLGGRTIQLGSPRFIQQNRNLSHNSFFLVSLKIFLFFPGKHKNRCVPEELPRTRDRQLHPGEGPTGFLPAAKWLQGFWGLQEARENIKKTQKQGSTFAPILPFLFPVLPRPGWDLGDEELLGVSPALPGQRHRGSSTLGMWQEGHRGAAEFPETERLLVVSCTARGWGIWPKREGIWPKREGIFQKEKEYGERIKNMVKG